jgi:putative alpha-1,2-mannosidase
MKHLICVMGIVIILGVGMVYPHAPSKINLNFERETQILSIGFEHQVRNAENHFVYQVKVRINKKDVVEQTLSRQDTEEGGTLIYKINGLQSGDVIEVRLNCMQGGSKSEKITIE